jgi:hypothetical protein
MSSLVEAEEKMEGALVNIAKWSSDNVKSQTHRFQVEEGIAQLTRAKCLEILLALKVILLLPSPPSPCTPTSLPSFPTFPPSLRSENAKNQTHHFHLAAYFPLSFLPEALNALLRNYFFISFLIYSYLL